VLVLTLKKMSPTVGEQDAAVHLESEAEIHGASLKHDESRVLSSQQGVAFGRKEIGRPLMTVGTDELEDVGSTSEGVALPVVSRSGVFGRVTVGKSNFGGGLDHFQGTYGPLATGGTVRSFEVH
jgi:hypothetical protein